MNFFRALNKLIKPRKAKVLDTRWLDNLPQNDYLAAQDKVLERLKDFVGDGNPFDRPALGALMAIDERGRSNVAALTEQYVQAPLLAFEIDERLWQSVYNHYHALSRAYQAFLDRYADALEQCPFRDDFPQLLLNLVDCQRCMAKWRYLRYQPMAEGAWLQLHRLYRLAESLGCAATPLSRYSGQSKTTVAACYLESLMLDTLNRTNMLKSEIETVAGWLSDWGGMMSLDQDYDEPRHLFFVDLEEDRGGRRIRNFTPADSYRYWETDAVVALIEQALQELRLGKPPAGLKLVPGARLPECLRLLEHLLAEWSRTAYQRQRRTADREGVAKTAQVVNGILNVCQQVKNVAFARKRSRSDELNASQPLEMAGGVEDAGDGIAFPGVGGEAWVIENESRYGFGAVVNANLNLWLRPGKLLALEYAMNREITAVGVVRSIKQLPANKRYVGIEVLSHTPAYVLMRELAESSHAQDYQSTDIFLASTLTAQGKPAFPALYLPKDEEQNMPATLLMPAIDYVAAEWYELRLEQYELRWERHVYQVQLGRVVEQKDDWVRVVAHVQNNQS